MRAASGRILMGTVVTARAVTVMAALAVAVMAAAGTPAALAAGIGKPAVTLTPSSGTAGSTANLGIDLKFSPSGGDTVKDLTLAFPPGLLADATVNGGACLSSATPTSACQVGTGTVTASGSTQSTAFDLVKPPRAGDLAGVAMLVNGSQFGSTGEVTVRPTGSAGGVGLTIAFANLPNSFRLVGPVAVPVSVTDVNTTFDGLRFPASCPASPATISVTADSYADATPQSSSAPLTVTGCAGLPYSPTFSVAAARDSGDQGVTLTTTVTQATGQATSGALSLTVPASVLAPNAGAATVLCSSPASGTCTPVGGVAAISPLYPTPLFGNAYLTGPLTAPALALVFPAPFPITLTGPVSLSTSSTTFRNIPDLPLSTLAVSLTGSSHGVFVATCHPASGTLTATLTAQNGDQTRTLPTAFTVSGCPPAPTGGKSPPAAGKGGKPRLDAGSLSGLSQGRPSLLFQLVAGKGAPALTAFQVTLPRGLTFVGHRTHGRLTLSGVSVTGASIKSATLQRGRLVVVLRRAVPSLIVSISGRALRESRSLRTQARRHRLKRLTLKVAVTDAAGRQTTLPVTIKKLRG